jgi:hypothetical protein
MFKQFDQIPVLCGKLVFFVFYRIVELPLNVADLTLYLDFFSASGRKLTGLDRRAVQALDNGLQHLRKCFIAFVAAEFARSGEFLQRRAAYGQTAPFRLSVRSAFNFEY